MKKITMLLVGVLVSSLTWAGKEDKSPKSVSGMAVVKVNATAYRLIYKSEEQSDVKVEIFDNKSSLIFSEKIKKSDGFVRPYNFASLPEGQYTIKIDNGSNWMTETVDYRAGSVEKVAQLVKLNDGKYMLRVAGVREDKLTIRILDEHGHAVRTDFEPVYGDFAQVYDLSTMLGSFSFEITDQSGVAKSLKK